MLSSFFVIIVTKNVIYIIIVLQFHTANWGICLHFVTHNGSRRKEEGL